MEKPQLYNVELSNCPRNNSDFISSVASIYNIPKDKVMKFIDDVNNGRKTIVACVPLDIAKTLSDVFVDSTHCKYGVVIDLQLSGKYDD